MNLDFVNELLNNIKENKVVQNFIKELSNYLEQNTSNNKWINLISDDLSINNKKIISKYKNKMLIERNNILQNYAKKTLQEGEMYYIYNTSEKNSYNLSNCAKSNEVITVSANNLPEGAELGSVLRKKENGFIIDMEATKSVGEQINKMINKTIQEQDKYLESKRVEGHIYEVGEKYMGRIWLYDLNNSTGSSKEGIEEIDFPKELYDSAKEGSQFLYKNGSYQKY